MRGGDGKKKESIPRGRAAGSGVKIQNPKYSCSIILGIEFDIFTSEPS